MGTFWEQHQKRMGRRADFGTTLSGNQTIPELQDLLTQKDDMISQGQSVINANGAAIAAKDMSLLPDWNYMLGRYATAKLAAQKAIANPGVLGPEHTDVQAEFDGVLRAVQQTAGTTTKGDLNELVLRLGTAGFPIKAATTAVQPRKDSDAALATYKQADKLTKKIEAAANVAKPYGIIAALAAVVTAVAIVISRK